MVVYYIISFLVKTSILLGYIRIGKESLPESILNADV